MQVVRGFPPNYRQIAAAFPVRGARVIFAYGDKIYNPAGITVTPELVEHEAVHQAQQGQRPDTWWTRYIAFPAFRLEQEVPAYRAEIDALVSKFGEPQRSKLTELVAKKLAVPLYGRGLVTLDRAVELLS
jgi:hypothetical protein